MYVAPVIDPPEPRTYARVEPVRASLIIPWPHESDEVVVEFHKLHSTFGGTFGNRIELRSRNQEQIVEETRRYIEVELEDVVPD